jgi:glycosyltransferase involved in cell wall biosynthesis
MSAPRPLRPTLLAPAYWPEVRRGTERVIRLLADGLRDAGHRPRLVTGHPGARRAVAEEDGLEVVRLPRPPAVRAAVSRGRIDEHAAHLPGVVAELVRDPGDVLHALYPTDAVAAALARRVHRLRGRRVPLVVSNMGPPDRRWARERRGRTTGLVTVARRADAVTTLSAFARDRVRAELAVDSLVVAPPVDLDAFAPPADDVRHAAPTILFASAPESDAKRLPLLLEAVALLRDRDPAVRLVVQAPRDPAARRALDAQPGVATVDLDDHAALREAYGRAWVTALPSRDEAFGLVVAESLACGTPAVACAGEGPAEIVVDDGVGRIAGAATPQALADALCGALRLAGEAGVRARCRAAVRDLGVDAHAARWLALYERLLADAAR